MQIAKKRLNRNSIRQEGLLNIEWCLEANIMRVIITCCPKFGILLTFASGVSSPVDLKFHESTTCIL